LRDFLFPNVPNLFG